MKNAISLEDVPLLTKADIFDINAAYEDVLTSILIDDHRQGMFHPSGVGSCGRKQVYCYIRAPFDPVVDSKSREIFDLGHAVHAVLSSRLSEMSRVLRAKSIGFEIEREVTFDPATDSLFSDLHVGGTADAVVRIWADAWCQRSIIEAKSINKANFEKLRGPKLPHLMQAHIYAYRFGCPIIYIWYVCKDNSERKVFPVVFDHKVFQLAVDYFDKLLKHVEAGTLPDRQEDYFACPRCEYRQICQPQIIEKLKMKSRNTELSKIRKRGRFGT